MKKFKIIPDFVNEEKFLNEMALQGYYLEKYNSLGVYTFREEEPQSLCYRIDYRTFSSKKQFEDYCALFEDAGWEHVYGTRHSGSQYFLPIPGRAQTDDIFSDKESKAGRYKRYSSQCFASLMLMITWLFILNSDNWKIWNVKSWYFTPGLWDMPGSLFWKAFLFETPFVILRVAPMILFFFMAILYGYWSVKAKDLYKKEIDVH